MEMKLKPKKVKFRGKHPVRYEYYVNGRILVIMRPTQFGKHQLPEPDIPDFIGNFWLIEEYTPNRHVSGQGVYTIWYKDLESAQKSLQLIVEKDLNVFTKEGKYPKLKIPQILIENGIRCE
jgi:hypothetical protein